MQVRHHLRNFRIVIMVKIKQVKLSCVHQKIGLLIKLWLVYGVFLSISAFVSINFCNFAVKQQ